MSQHLFNTIHNGEVTTILMGWDKPLQGFFLVIEKPSDGIEPFWSNLTHHEPPHPKTLNLFLDVLNNLGIILPNQMVEEIIKDGEENIGNKEVAHTMESGIYHRW